MPAKVEQTLFGELWRPNVDVRSNVHQLHCAGELERIPVMPGTRGEMPGTRWRWRRKPLTGAIVDVERAFHDPGDGA